MEYKYEVAFSFLKKDENLAIELNDLLVDRFSTFLYSKKQENVAGADGEETFNRIFGNESRIVVVLYRNGWGKTSWTRIEETAIRNRAYEEGYDFVLFILLDKSHKIPRWLPKTQIWIDLERWGLEGAASVIESRVQQEGGEPRVESIHDQAARIKRQRDCEEKRKKFLNSIEGVKCAEDNIQQLFNLTQSLIKKISSDNKIPLVAHRRDKFTLDFSSDNIWIALDWLRTWGNTLDNSKLRLRMTKGIPDRPRVLNFNETIILTEKEILFTTDYNEKPRWQIKESNILFNNNELAEYLIKMLLNKVSKKK
jgi:hypothetical protein